MRAILTYHSIDPSGSPVSVAPEAFESHLDWLASGRVEVLALDELLGEPRDGDAVALTFDDALTSLAEIAWPALRRRGLPATVFVASSYLGRDNAWQGDAEPGIPNFPVVDSETLQHLASEGLSVGSHGRSHRDLTTLTDAELEDELEGSAGDLEGLVGTRPTTIAYPYGRVDDRVARAASSAYRWGVTTQLRPMEGSEDPLRVPRLDAWYLRRRRSLRAWGTRRFRSYVALRRLIRSARGRS